MEAFKQNRLSETESKADIPFYLVPVTLDLVNDHHDLIESIRIALRDKNPLAVCLDTLNRSIAGSESNDKDMTAYIRAADAIREAFDCAVVIVHHCGIDGSRPRGHTSLTGAADAQIAVSRAKDGNFMATVECMKDGPDGDTFCSRLEQAVVGKDKDGEEITSCIVLEAEPMARATPDGPRLSANQSTMLAILKDAMPEGLRQSDWYEQARTADIGVKRKATLTDCCLALKEKNLVDEFDGIWKLINRG